jgi:ABC transporter, permease protein
MILYPLFITVSRALMGEADMNDTTVVMLPKHLSLAMLKLAAGSDLLNYWPSLLTTLGYVTGLTVLQTIACLLAGYGFGRFDLPFKRTLFALVIFTILVPPQLFTPAFYLQMRSFDFFGLIEAIRGEPLNLVGGYIPMVLLAVTGNGIKNGLFIYIFRQNFRNMPAALEEAAYVDGAGHIRIFTRIMVPNAITTIVTVALFSFVWQYNDTYYSGIYLSIDAGILSLKFNEVIRNSMALENIGLSISQIFNPIFVRSLYSAAAVLVLLPVILVYCIFQRYFIEGVERSGLVG